MKYKDLLWRICWSICKFFAWHVKSSMYYKVTGSYKDLPRSWEVGASFFNMLGTGHPPLKSLRMAFKSKWVIRDKLPDNKN